MDATWQYGALSTEHWVEAYGPACLFLQDDVAGFNRYVVHAENAHGRECGARATMVAERIFCSIMEGHQLQEAWGGMARYP